jgi:hypothetical protein
MWRRGAFLCCGTAERFLNDRGVVFAVSTNAINTEHNDMNSYDTWVTERLAHSASKRSSAHLTITTLEFARIQPSGLLDQRIARFGLLGRLWRRFGSTVKAAE